MVLHVMKRLIVIRGELSIMASIMILCHNIFFGKTYFVRLFTSALTMPVTQLLAAIASLLMLVIYDTTCNNVISKGKKENEAKALEKTSAFCICFLRSDLYSYLPFDIFKCTGSPRRLRTQSHSLYNNFWCIPCNACKKISS